jgi:hypothetical protein
MAFYKVRFTTSAALVNELREARYGRVELLIRDEIAYVPLSRPRPSCGLGVLDLIVFVQTHQAEEIVPCGQRGVPGSLPRASDLP